MEAMLQRLVHLYVTASEVDILRFYGALAAFLLLVLILVRHGRGYQLTKSLGKQVAEMNEEIGELGGVVERMGGGDAGRLDVLLAERMEPRLEAMEGRVQDLDALKRDLLEERSSELWARMKRTAAELQSTQVELKALQRRLADMERRLEGAASAAEAGEGPADERASGVDFSKVPGAVHAALGQALGHMRKELQGGLEKLAGIEEQLLRKAEEKGAETDAEAGAEAEPAPQPPVDRDDETDEADGGGNLYQLEIEDEATDGADDVLDEDDDEGSDEPRWV